MKRLEKIASLVTKDAKIIDIGTDHAYLPIYLYENNITHDITASDISENVLNYAKKNISDANLEDKIKVIKSDGFKDVKESYDEAIIAGMGTNTIIDILSHGNIPNSLIICSHNNLDILRKYMLDNEYKIVDEVIVYDKRYYDVIKYIKGKDNLTEEDILFGKSNDLEYLNYLKDKYETIYSKSKNIKYLDYIKIIEKKLNLKK